MCNSSPFEADAIKLSLVRVVKLEVVVKYELLGRLCVTNVQRQSGGARFVRLDNGRRLAIHKRQTKREKQGSYEREAFKLAQRNWRGEQLPFWLTGPKFVDKLGRVGHKVVIVVP